MRRASVGEALERAAAEESMRAAGAVPDGTSEHEDAGGVQGHVEPMAPGGTAERADGATPMNAGGAPTDGGMASADGGTAPVNGRDARADARAGAGPGADPGAGAGGDAGGDAGADPGAAPGAAPDAAAEPRQPALEIRGLTKCYPRADHPAVDGVWLDVEEGEILTLVGESGSGKTTLLRLVAGLERSDSGSITIRGRTVCDERCYTPPEHRGVSLVFQDYALFPHLTVERNVAFGLRRLGRAERADRVREMLALVGLEGLERRYPHELSGGQQQRVALARALAPRPAVLLLDEPFSNLDRALKARLREEVAALIRATGTTAVFVVHDPDDALAIGDRIAVLRDGRLVQLGKPREILDSPCGPYVAGFFGGVVTGLGELGGIGEG